MPFTFNLQHTMFWTTVFVLGCTPQDTTTATFAEGESRYPIRTISYLDADQISQDETQDDGLAPPVPAETTMCRLLANTSLAIIELRSEPELLDYCEHGFSQNGARYEAEVIAVVSGKELPTKIDLTSFHRFEDWRKGDTATGRFFLLSIRHFDGAYFGANRFEAVLNQEGLVGANAIRDVPNTFSELVQKSRQLKREWRMYCSHLPPNTDSDFERAFFNPEYCNGPAPNNRPPSEAELCASENPPPCCFDDTLGGCMTEE